MTDRRNSPPADGARRWSSLAKKAALHLLVVAVVTITPLIAYDRINALALDGDASLNRFMRMGGLTYPLYLSYWLMKVRSNVLRYTALQVVFLASAIFIAMDTDLLPSDALFLLPMLLTVPCLLLCLWTWRTGSRARSKALLVAWLLSLPLALVFMLWTGQGLGTSAMGGMRW